MGVRNEIFCFTVSSTELYVHSRCAMQKPLFWIYPIGLAQRQSNKGGQANFTVNFGPFLVHVVKTNRKLYLNSESFKRQIWWNCENLYKTTLKEWSKLSKGHVWSKPYVFTTNCCTNASFFTESSHQTIDSRPSESDLDHPKRGN